LRAGRRMGKRGMYGKGGGGPAMEEVQGFDEETEQQLEAWVQAKRSRDYATADTIRDELRDKGVDPQKVRPDQRKGEGKGGRRQAQPPAMPGMYDAETEHQLDMWVEAKRARDFVNADAIRDELRSRGIDAQVLRPSKRDQARSQPPAREAYGGYGGGNPYAAYGGCGGPVGYGRPADYGAPMMMGGPPVLWIGLSQASSITDEGLPPEAPVVTWEKGVDVFASSSNVLHEFVGDGEVEVVHDPDWQLFPEVANATKSAGCEDQCLAVAFCKAAGKWGVGLGGAWKPRENAAKLALCVALSVDNPQLPGVVRNNPDFGAMMASQGFAGQQPTKSARSKRGKAKSAAPAEEDAGAGGLPALAWVSLTEDSSLTAQGMPAEAPALKYDKSQSVFSCGHHVLRDIVDEIETEVVFTHDADGNEFPEVGRALEQSVGSNDEGICIAVCEKYGKWALGLASGWKARESAAKLALAVAICSEGGPALDSMAAQYPDFGALCASSGFVANDAAETGGLGGGLGAAPAPEHQSARSKRRKKAATVDEDVGLGESAPDEAVAGSGNLLPRDASFWLKLAAAPGMLIETMPAESIMLVHGEAQANKGLYRNADSLLALYLERPESDVEYVDDANWEQFPEITAALEDYNIKDELLHVAVCGISNVWAAASGAKWKTRQTAAKVALAAVLALQAAESGNQSPEISNYPEFAQFVDEALLSRNM